MKQFFKFFLASLLAVIIAGGLFFIFVFGMFGAAVSSLSTEQSVVIKNKSVLYINLTEPLNELEKSNVMSVLTGGKSKSAGLYDVLQSIQAAKADDKIKGIYIKTGGSPNGWATNQQIREALEDFKLSNKFVYAYGDFISQRDFYVASTADSLFLSPVGNIEVKGLSTTITFFKGAMDKLGVKAEIFYCGDFKSATEPFRATKMSPENRIQQAAIQQDLWVNLSQAYAKKANVDTAEVRNWINTAAIQHPADALNHHIIDGLRYKDEVENLLKTKLDIESNEDINFVLVADYAKTITASAGIDQIAILVAEGNIVDGFNNSSDVQIASETFIKEIRKVKDNDKIKAVVLRINSPGGSAMASEYIHRELTLLKAKKPLVVSMGDYAASGGYYMACLADSIFALPNTITGSIGVFGMMVNPQELLNNKLGITTDTEKNGPYADFPNLMRKMTDKEKQIIQSGVDSVYIKFKSRVAEGRKTNIAYVDSVGQGRVWTGNQALALNLVDAIGGLDRALQSAASLAKIDKYKVTPYPKPKDQMQEILDILQGKSGDQVLIKKAIEQTFTEEYKTLQFFNMIKENKSNNWMLMPQIPNIQ